MKYKKENELQYWTNYYKKHWNSFEPSFFAKSVMKYLTKGDKLIDLGCGNGRDTIYFSENKIYSYGVDIISDEIHLLNNLFKNNDYVSFAVEDLSKLPIKKFDHAYSRFTLHSITVRIEKKLLDWIKKNISKYLFIEVRSDQDKLFGEKTDHYRRFLNLEKLLIKLINNNFQVIYSEISKEFAPYIGIYEVNYNEKNPPVIRIVCKINNEAPRRKRTGYQRG